MGEYKLINHGKDISKVKKFVIIRLENDRTIAGKVDDTREQTGDTPGNTHDQ